MKVNLFSSARRTSYRQEMIIDVAGDEVTLNITASQRRTMRLQVTEEGSVDLRIPLNSSRNEVLRFVKLHEPWLHERLEQVRERLQKRGDALLLYGKERPYVASALGEFLVTDEQVWVPEGWTDAQREKAVEQWLRQEARHEFSYWINHWWPDFSAFAPQQPVLRVKKMKTRWGTPVQFFFALLPVRQTLCQQTPEPRAMIKMTQMTELMHNHQLHQFMRQCQ